MRATWLKVGVCGVLLIGCEQPSKPETRVFTRDDFDAPSKPIEEAPPTGEPMLPDPITLPATWCAGDSLLQTWSEVALTEGFDRWDDLVPDEDLFAFLGSCEERSDATVHINRVLFVDNDVIIGGIWAQESPIEIFLAWEPRGDQRLHSPIDSPDVECADQVDLGSFIGSMVGRVMGLPFACVDQPFNGCPPIERESLMGLTSTRCDIRLPNAWDIEQFNLAQGVDVPLP